MQNLQRKSKNLADYVVELQSGSRPRGGVRDILSGVPSIGGEHLNSFGGFDFTSVRYVSEDFANLMTKGKLLPNDILIVKDGATTGKVSFIDNYFPFNNATINEHVFILRVNNDILPKFLFWYLWSEKGKTEILNNFQGSAQGGINRSFLDGVKVPIFSINEQKEILGRINNLIPQTWQNKNKLEQVKLSLNRFKQSILSAAITGKLTEDWRSSNNLEEYEENGSPTGWVSVPIIKTLLPKGIFDGPFGSNLKTSDYTDSGVRVIRLENIGFLEFINANKTYISEEKYQGLKKHTVHEKDLIFSSFIADKVRCVVLPKLDEIVIAKADCFCLRVNKEVVDVNFLAYLLSSKQTYDTLVSFTHGATRPRINTTQLRNLEILLPPLKEQEKLVRRIGQYFEIADKVEKQIEKAEVRVSKLTQAILGKTYRSDSE